MKELSHHFNCGNSTTGTVGFCARVTAGCTSEAVNTLKRAMEATTEIGVKMPGIEYFNLYTNPEALTVDDIDEIDGVVVDYVEGDALSTLEADLQNEADQTPEHPCVGAIVELGQALADPQSVVQRELSEDKKNANPNLDAETLYYAVRGFVERQEGVEIISDYTDDLLSNACRALAGEDVQ